MEMHLSPHVRPVIPRFGHNYVRFILRSLVFTIPQSHVGEKTPYAVNVKNVKAHFTSQLVCVCVPPCAVSCAGSVFGAST